MSASTSKSASWQRPTRSVGEHMRGLLERAYWMEIESVMSYIAASTNLDGIRAQQIRDSLEEDGRTKRALAPLRGLLGSARPTASPEGREPR